MPGVVAQAPVSYTHLDVYKRQIYGGGKQISRSGAAPSAIASLYQPGFLGWIPNEYDLPKEGPTSLSPDGSQGEGAVSYTHLDVYKRQATTSRRPPWRAGAGWWWVPTCRSSTPRRTCWPGA